MASLNRIFYGQPWPFEPAAASMIPTDIDATTDGIEVIFQAEEAMTITRLGFAYSGRTGTPPTYIVSLQGVSSGTANGTIKGGGSPASKTFTPPASSAWDNSFQWQTLTNSYTCTRGELLAIVVAYSSGTVNASNFSNFVASNGSSTTQNFPYAVTIKTGSKTKATGSVPVWGYAAGTTAYGRPISGHQVRTYGSTSTPDEYAMAFSIPGSGGTYKLAGVRAFVSPGTIGANNCKFILYSGTTVLQEVNWSANDAMSTTTGWVSIFFQDTTLATLNTGTTYRLGVQPQSATTWSFRSLALASADDLTAFPGGTAFYESSRVDAGAWSDDTTKRPIMGLILDDLTLPTPGALMYHPGMSGGME